MEVRKNKLSKIDGCETGQGQNVGREEERKCVGKEGFGHKLRFLWTKKSWPMQERHRSWRDRGGGVEGAGGHGSNVQRLDARWIGRQPQCGQDWRWEESRRCCAGRNPWRQRLRWLPGDVIRSRDGLT